VVAHHAAQAVAAVVRNIRFENVTVVPHDVWFRRD
jgi:hypothetical protein